MVGKRLHLTARQMIVSGALLAAFAIAGATLVAFTWQQTHEQIAKNERETLLRSLHDILPERAYDNELYADTIEVSDPELLGTDQPVTVFRARKNGQPVAALFTVIAPNGYGGPIKLLVGIRYNGSIAGVRVIDQHETPGLGDKVESDRSDWIYAFKGKSLDNPKPENWAVKKDGGRFDQFTGATITPRAVVKAVHNALIYFKNHCDALFRKTAAPEPKTGSSQRVGSATSRERLASSQKLGARSQKPI